LNYKRREKKEKIKGKKAKKSGSSFFLSSFLIFLSLVRTTHKFHIN